MSYAPSCVESVERVRSSVASDGADAVRRQNNFAIERRSSLRGVLHASPERVGWSRLHVGLG
jgi:hypothetical protein